MNIRRPKRLKVAGTSAVYHCMSRVAGGEPLLGTTEKEVFRKQLHRLADFCGVEVLTYCVMSNHFHLLVRVPPEEEAQAVSNLELERRVRRLYPKEEAQAWVSRLRGEEAGATRQRLLARMGDVSVYLKELKQRFSIWYNHTHGRYGTLWSERFKSVLVEPTGRALLTVAAYIDLNPIRAGMVSRPEDYRWSGYGEACGGGRRASQARNGLGRMLGEALRDPGLCHEWERTAARYRVLLYEEGREVEADPQRGEDGRLGFSEAEVEGVREGGGKMPLREALRRRVRYFADGAVLGSAAFVDSVFEREQRLRRRFGEKRRTGARRMRGADWGGLRVLRDLRKDVIGK
jgi:putative transposase